MTNQREANLSKKNETRDLYYRSPASEKKVNLTTTIISCAVTLAAGFLLGFNFDTLSAQFSPYLGGKTSANLDFSSLNDLYQELVADYDGTISPEKAVQEAKRGLVKAADDPYTYYMTAQEYSDFNKDLNGDVGAGIGVEIGQRDGLVKVLRTTPDNPARRAGVLAGDIIYKADGEDISALSVEEVAKKLRGAEGSKIKLTVVRDSKEIDFDLTREVINNPSVYAEMRGKTAIITITRFDEDTGSLARQEANNAKNKGADKIILDLRGNGGGYVTAAVDVASLWLDGDVIMVQKSINGFYDKTYYANRGQAVLSGIKTVVLVNGSTASASEIVAGALKDHGKATLIGEKTYGKGSVQSLETLSAGEVLRVTIAKWYTPKDVNINKEGIQPDEVIERSFEQINKEIDPQLDAALAK